MAVGTKPRSCSVATELVHKMPAGLMKSFSKFSLSSDWIHDISFPFVTPNSPLLIRNKNNVHYWEIRIMSTRVKFTIYNTRAHYPWHNILSVWQKHSRSTPFMARYIYAWGFNNTGRTPAKTHGQLFMPQRSCLSGSWIIATNNSFRNAHQF
jgi:hypothetical protein